MIRKKKVKESLLKSDGPCVIDKFFADSISRNL